MYSRMPEPDPELQRSIIDHEIATKGVSLIKYEWLPDGKAKLVHELHGGALAVSYPYHKRYAI